MWKVIGFKTPNELQDYLRAGPIAAAKVISIYFDGASGQHMLVLAP